MSLRSSRTVLSTGKGQTWGADRMKGFTSDARLRRRPLDD
jgi:hypothetical protein